MLEPLDDQETLTYLHSCVSFRPVSLRPPEGVQLIEMISKEESGLINTDALNKAADANDALTELAEDAVGFGHFTPVITVWDEDPDALSRAQDLRDRDRR